MLTLILILDDTIYIPSIILLLIRSINIHHWRKNLRSWSRFMGSRMCKTGKSRSLQPSYRGLVLHSTRNGENLLRIKRLFLPKLRFHYLFLAENYHCPNKFILNALFLQTHMKFDNLNKHFLNMSLS